MPFFRTLNRVARDIGNGKHIESYAIALAAVVFAILSVIEDALSLDAQIAIILAAVGVLVFKSTAPDVGDEDIELERILKDRQNYGPFREFIRGGKELLIYAPSAVNILTNAADIEREILDRGGSMRVVLQDPTHRESIQILQQQLDKMGSPLLINDIERSTAILEGLIARQKDVNYRLAPYSPGFSLVVVDPDGRNGRLVVEFFGYGNERIIERMHIVIHRRQSQYWFEYWAAQFEQMWENARTNT